MVASPLSLPLLLLSTVLLLSPFLAATRSLTGNPMIIKTCNKTYYPNDCLKAFKPYQKSPKPLDLPGMARISILISSSKVKESYPEVKNYVLNAPDYPTWANYAACLDFYNRSVVDMNHAIQSFDGKKYQEAFSKVDSVNGAIVSCNNFAMQPIAEINGGLIRLTNNTGSIVKLLI